MLSHLQIQNYALIQHLSIDFSEGFSVITGQTGAGKSILLGALGLLLGNRADTHAIKAGAQKCVIEADFLLSSEALVAFMETNELDFDGQHVTIRREIAATGKTRAFVNDTPVALSLLRELGPWLIDIHSQHQNLLLQQADFQLSVLDALYDSAPLMAQYKQTFADWREAVRSLRETEQTQQNNKSDQDYLSFLYEQLASAQLQEGEQEQLEQEMQTLEHAEEIKTALYATSNLLTQEERGVVDRLREAQREMVRLASLFPAADDLAKRIDSCYIELKDIDDSVQEALGEVDFEPGRLQKVSDRLSIIYDLQQRHHVQSVPELLKIQKELGEKLSLIENHDEILAQMRLRIKNLETQLRQRADQLSQARHQAAPQLEEQITLLLRPMGMANVRFQVEIQSTAGFEAAGTDHVQFLFSANQGSPLQPIRQIASGGEIARVMLAVKAILSEHRQMPTIVFDEIDTGVSGSIAECMAQTMRRMSSKPNRQVISITHLPQIAALGSHHYRVYKEDSDDVTQSHIEKLDAQQREQEIAHMLSGANLTEAALSNARALLNQNV